MTESFSKERVSFSEQKYAILEKVTLHGSVDDMAAWREAFPGIEFMEVDEELSGKSVKWETYTPTERAAYVIYMSDPHNSELNYKLNVDGLPVKHEIPDSESLWYCWLAHAMRYFEERGELTNEALELLLHYAAQGQFEEMIMDFVDIDEVTVDSMEFYHKPMA